MLTDSLWRGKVGGLEGEKVLGKGRGGKGRGGGGWS